MDEIKKSAEPQRGDDVKHKRTAGRGYWVGRDAAAAGVGWEFSKRLNENSQNLLDIQNDPRPEMGENSDVRHLLNQTSER